MIVAAAIVAVLLAIAGLAAWVRRPIARRDDAGRAAADATVRAALASAAERRRRPLPIDRLAA